MTKSLPLLQYSPWSPSKADMAATCPLSFKYRYVDKLKPGLRGESAKIGVTVHKAQEFVFTGLPISEAIDQAITSVDEVLTEKEIEKVLTFAAALETFKTKLDSFKNKHPVREVLLEKQWAITPDFKPCDFFSDDGMIRGVVDMGLLLEENVLIIIDHKTGRLRPVEYYGTQLDVYSIMGEAHYPEVQGVQCALNYMAHDKISWDKYRPVSKIKEHLRPWLVELLNNRAVGVEGFEAKVGFHCKWCDFREICPKVGECSELKGSQELGRKAKRAMARANKDVAAKSRRVGKSTK